MDSSHSFQNPTLRSLLLLHSCYHGDCLATYSLLTSAALLLNKPLKACTESGSCLSPSLSRDFFSSFLLCAACQLALSVWEPSFQPHLDVTTRTNRDPESTFTHLSLKPQTPPLGIHSTGFKDCSLLKWKQPRDRWTQLSVICSEWRVLSNPFRCVGSRLRTGRAVGYYSPGVKKAENTLPRAIFVVCVNGRNKKQADKRQVSRLSYLSLHPLWLPPLPAFLAFQKDESTVEQCWPAERTKDTLPNFWGT